MLGVVLVVLIVEHTLASLEEMVVENHNEMMAF